MTRKRWDAKVGDRVERPDVDAFLDEVIAVCKKHGMSISHEDGHGGFMIEEYGDGYTDWLQGASDNRAWTKAMEEKLKKKKERGPGPGKFDMNVVGPGRYGPDKK